MLFIFSIAILPLGYFFEEYYWKKVVETQLIFIIFFFSGGIVIFWLQHPRKTADDVLNRRYRAIKSLLFHHTGTTMDARS